MNPAKFLYAAKLTHGSERVQGYKAACVQRNPQASENRNAEEAMARRATWEQKIAPSSLRFATRRANHALQEKRIAALGLPGFAWRQNTGKSESLRPGTPDRLGMIARGFRRPKG
jgi:hypothetical protein